MALSSAPSSKPRTAGSASTLPPSAANSTPQSRRRHRLRRRRKPRPRTGRLHLENRERPHHLPPHLFRHQLRPHPPRSHPLQNRRSRPRIRDPQVLAKRQTQAKENPAPPHRHRPTRPATDPLHLRRTKLHHHPPNGSHQPPSLHRSPGKTTLPPRRHPLRTRLPRKQHHRRLPPPPLRPKPTPPRPRRETGKQTGPRASARPTAPATTQALFPLLTSHSALVTSSLSVLTRTTEQLESAIAAGIQQIYCDFEDPRRYKHAVELARDSESAKSSWPPPASSKPARPAT